MTWTWAEPFAGAAACALRLVGGERLKPPVAWMGGKRRYARAILDAMGVPEEPPSRVLLADAGPWGWVWPLLLAPESAARVAAVLRSWAGEHPRELWQRLAAVPPAEGLHERAAQWLWLQARSASGVPIWWDGWREAGAEWRMGEEQKKSRRGDRTIAQKGNVWLASAGRGEPRPAGARAVGGRWEMGKTEGRDAAQPAWQKDTPGSWRFDARPGDRAPDRAAGMSGWTKGNKGREQPAGRGQRDTASRTGGMVNPATIAARIEALAEAFRRVEVQVRHGDAGGLEAPAAGPCVECGHGRRTRKAAHCQAARCSCAAFTVAPVFCYLDPPYRNATGYGWDMPRGEVLALARRWADAGAVVAVSEAEPLELPGWHHLELTREGGKPEWLTLSRAPARVPARQVSLFAEGA